MLPLEPRLEKLAERKLIGKRMEMSLADNKTFALWQSFMQQRKEIQNSIGSELYSLQVYNSSYFKSFDPAAKFEKWAAIEATNFDNVPAGMEAFILQAGLYAVFLHKGAASTGAGTFRYIFNTWLPGSGYELDDRPHFELLGEKYKNDSPDSEEEIWIPIKDAQ